MLEKAFRQTIILPQIRFQLGILSQACPRIVPCVSTAGLLPRGLQRRYFVPRWRFCGDTFEDTLFLREGASQPPAVSGCSGSVCPATGNSPPQSFGSNDRFVLLRLKR